MITLVTVPLEITAPNIEYGLLAAFVSLAVIASIDAIGGSLNTTYQSFATEVEDFTP